MFPANPLRFFWTILIAFPLLRTVLASSVAPRDHADTSHPAFVHTSAYGNVTFAPTAIRENGDLYFHFEAPAGNSWVAVGIGSEMKGSLIWVFYRSANGKGVTLCSRTSSGHVEPTHNTDVDCDIIEQDGVFNGIQKVGTADSFVANVHCKAVGSNPSAPFNEVDFENNSQDFIFAFGPTDRKLRSDEKAAGIRRHSMFGHFTLDLAASSVNTTADVDIKELGKVGEWKINEAQLKGLPEQDSEWAGAMHAFMMCGAFIVIFPLGVVFLRLLDRVKWHGWMQGVGLGFLLGGLGLGIWAGTMYNHSKTINNPHQLIGITAVSLVLFQFSLGFLHHYLYTHRRDYRPTILNLIHKHLGLPVLLLGVVNGFLGFDFAGGTWHKIAYPIIAGVVYLALGGALVWVKKVRTRSKKRVEDRRLQDEAYEAFKHQKAERDEADAEANNARGRDHEEMYGDVSLREISADRSSARDFGPEHPRSIV